ncbi:hypothetical protein EKO04_000028 [Ascochyta lentis]|uniref:FAD dependent oxidoreductase domain-containing protein n=1 Tax=Ascochyta lentis TaxID=205686 RepID=A0A8H7MHR5_9PLEO|nr:hypothetical protein EKO04_000028 [Ascochyta lentis]
MTRQILPVPNPVLSYWLRDPHAYADLRSSPRLPAECDVVVVGAGLAGVLAAYHILTTTDEIDEEGDGTEAQDGVGGGFERGKTKVMLIDARQLCSGATARNGGHVKVQVKTLLNLENGEKDGGKKRTEFQDYVTRVMHELKRIAEQEELDCEFELRRSFDVFTDAQEAEDIHHRYETARKRGEGWTTNVSWIGAQMVEQVTSISGAKGAFSVPAASFWPYKFVMQLLERMVARWPHRLNIQMNTPVTRLTTTSSDTTILVTDRGSLTAAKIVLATNAYTAGLLPSFTHAVIPVRGMASHHTPKHPIHPHLANTYNIAFGPQKGVDYLNPRPDGSIVVGGGAWLFGGDMHSWRGNWDDAHLFSEEVMRYWHEYMADRFLGWGNSGAVNDSAWTGIMGRTVDGQPFVVRVPGRENIWVLAGFNGGGMAIIALCAKAVGKMVVQGKGFGEVWEEEGLLECFGATEGRMGI